MTRGAAPWFAAIALFALACLTVDAIGRLRIKAAAERRLSAEDLRARSARVDALALDACVGMLHNYDDLVSALDDLRDRAQRFDAVPGTPAVAALTTFTTALDARTRDIEDIKARRAVLRNSEEALVPLLREANAKGAPAALGALQRDLVAFLLLGDGATSVALHLAKTALLNDEALRDLAPHLAHLADQRQFLAQAAGEIRDEGLAVAADAIVAATAGDEDAGHRAAAALRELILVLVVITSGLAAWWTTRRPAST